MALKVTKVDVWAGEMQDKPGELGRMLGALAGAGASIDCVIGRRQPDTAHGGAPNTGSLGSNISISARNSGRTAATSFSSNPAGRVVVSTPRARTVRWHGVTSGKLTE